MQSCFRRLYSTLPEAATSARTASTPRAVRLRRIKKEPALATGESDATPDGLTPTEFTRYQRELAKGELSGPDGRSLTEGEWLDKLNGRRSRVRGTREVVTKDGSTETKVVGQKVYLPNIIFRLVRNHTLSGKPYNPYEATFRVPQSVTKTDIRSYLLAVYGVKTTYIRTDNYLSPVDRMGNTKAIKTYKRAVVGLVEPFYYPQAVEDMTAKEREERENWLEQTFEIKAREETRRSEFLRITRAESAGWKWRTGTTAKRGTILRLIAERRAAREEAVSAVKSSMLKARQSGESVL